MAEISIEVTDAMILEFREFYEEFADATKWTNAQIRKALYIARGEIGGCGCAGGWGDYKPYSFLQRAWFALAAYYLTWNRAASGATLADGSASTPYAMSSKSVRDESVSYSIPSANDGLTTWEAALALTPYGLEFLHLRSRASVGAICV